MFLPEGYKEPAGQYFKFKEGKNTFRILSSAVTGYEYWNKEDKPVRSKTAFKGTPTDCKIDSKTGKPQLPKHFWSFVIYNQNEGGVQIMQLNQRSLQQDILALVDNSKWGDPKGYDITITKTGSGMATEYTVMPNPHSPAPEVDISHINLEALFTGDDPFASSDGLANEFATPPEPKKKK